MRAGCPRSDKTRLRHPAPEDNVATMDKNASYQSFDDQSDAATVAPRLASLRAELGRRGLDGFLVPRADEHQGEYVPKKAERLAWLTSFTGSAGSAVVLK